MIRRAFLFSCCAAALIGCQSTPSADADQPKPPEPAANSFPGHDSPPLAELLQEAKAKSTPKEAHEPYAPRDVDVPELAETHVEMLPKSDDGKPLLAKESGALLEVDEDLSDPITAAATCMQLATSCVQTPDIADARDIDSCVASTRTCRDNHPWDDPTPCCPDACKQLHAALRNDGYSMLEAWTLTTQSDCFPSMREFFASARKADQKAAAEEAKP